MGDPFSLAQQVGFPFLRKSRFPSLHGERARGEGMPLSRFKILQNNNPTKRWGYYFGAAGGIRTHVRLPAN